MWNEARIREGLERRLSGLEASGERRARIRDAVATCQKEERTMKRKLSMALVAALALIAIAAAVAVAARAAPVKKIRTFFMRIPS